MRLVAKGMTCEWVSPAIMYAVISKAHVFFMIIVVLARLHLVALKKLFNLLVVRFIRIVGTSDKPVLIGWMYKHCA